LWLLVTGCAARGAEPGGQGTAGKPVLWRQTPSTVESGSGAPQPPFTFVKEDREGASPKFVVTDARGAEWHAKLGVEAHSDTAAARLVARMGYYTETAYYLPTIQVAGVQVERGREYVGAGGRVTGVRMEARSENVERGDQWDWAANPFVGSPELDGLKVLMLLINNYDARTANNRVLTVRTSAGVESRYAVADLGASFGRYGGLGGTRTKLDPQGFAASRFIESVRDGRVRFAFRTRPEGLGLTLFVLNPFYVAGELKKSRDLNDLPIASVRWIAARLRTLTESELRTAFEASGCDRETTESLTNTIRRRIAELEDVSRVP
jgi:hypothetical protein